MKTIYALVLSVLLAIPVLADEPPSGNQPKASFPEQRFRFTGVTEGDIVHHDFILKNGGRAPLEIIKIVPG